jgi:putative membrane protein
MRCWDDMATTPSDPPHEEGEVTEGRLHPLSWLFVFLGQLKNLGLPLLALVVVGRGAWWELLGMAAAVPLALYALVYSLGFRYRLGRGELVVKEGLLQRAERHVPYARIQNVVQRRNPLHRLFGVTELRLESAGGSEPEAVMNVIRLDEARRIEAALRGAAPSEESAAEPAPLLVLGGGDLVRLGLATNRGAVVLGGLIAVYWQFEPWEWHWKAEEFRHWRERLEAWQAGLPGPVGTAAIVAAALGAFLVMLKLLSVLMAVFNFHGFRLELRGRRVASEAGLLTRHAASAQCDKIQRLLFEETWLARRLGRRRLSCDVASGGPGQEQHGARLRWLAPIGTPGQLRRVADQVVPGLDPDALVWRPLHPRAWRRRFRPDAVLWTLLAAVAAPRIGAAAGLCWLVALLISYVAARGEARFAAYACDETRVGYRAGWLRRQWTLARIEKGQAVRLSRSPFDRRAGMASVALDTAGATPRAPRLLVPYLAEAEARALVDRLRAGIAAS